MTTIGVERATEGLELHSCPSCGQHAWRSGGLPVSREQVLAALQVHRPATAPVPPAVVERRQAPPADGDRRSELQRLLSDFTAHGSTS